MTYNNEFNDVWNWRRQVLKLNLPFNLKSQNIVDVDVAVAQPIAKKTMVRKDLGSTTLAYLENLISLLSDHMHCNKYLFHLRIWINNLYRPQGPTIDFDPSNWATFFWELGWGSIITTFGASYIFGGNWVIRKNWLEPKTNTTCQGRYVKFLGTPKFGSHLYCSYDQ